MPVARAEIHTAGQAVAARYAPQLRQEALNSNWPPDLAARLGVRFTDEGQFAVSVDGGEEIPEEILDQEFGTADSGPKSAIGNFFLDEVRQRQMQREINEQLKGFVQSFADALRGRS